jgi:hypothetical protein
VPFLDLVIHAGQNNLKPILTIFIVIIGLLFLVVSCEIEKEPVTDDSNNGNETDILLAQSEKTDDGDDFQSKTLPNEADKPQVRVTENPSPVVQTSTPIPQTKLNMTPEPTPTVPLRPTPTFTATASPIPVTLDETYDNDTNGISIDYPSGWVIEENYEDDQSWLLKILSSSGSYVEIIGEHAPGAKLKQFVSYTIGLDEQYREQNRVPIEDMPGYLSEGMHIFKKNPIKIVMFLNGEWAIHATFIVADLQDGSTLDLMRDSFKLKNP